MTVDGSPWDRHVAGLPGWTREGTADDRPLGDRTVPELRDIARGLDIDGASSMRKGDLVDAIGRASGAAGPAEDHDG